MLLHRGQFAFLAAVLVGAYGVDRGLTALCASTAAYYATRYASSTASVVARTRRPSFVRVRVTDVLFLFFATGFSC